MIVTEFYKVREDGIVLNRTYSDAGMMIERDGVFYSEAIDPEGFNRQYVETNELIKPMEVPKQIIDEFANIQSDSEFFNLNTYIASLK